MKNINVILACLFLCLGQSFLPAQVVWDGGGDNINWDDPLNWSADAIPIATDDVEINNTLANVIIPAGYSAVAKSLLNKGTFTIATLASLNLTGIAAASYNLINEGDITNVGDLFIYNTNGKSLYNKIGANFTNQKTIIIEGDNTTEGIFSQGDFENQALAMITVTHTKSGGISSNTGTFTNRGQITVSDCPLQALVYNSDSGLFINETTGVMNLSDGAYGINNYNGGGTFINKGSIVMTNTSFAGLNNQSIFENQATGTISLTNTDAGQMTAVSIIYGEMTNDGTISVTNAAPGEGWIMYNDTYLRGSGTVTVSSYMIIHSHLSPGHSPGTITINGDVDMSDVTSSYEAEIESAANYDKINIDGNLTLGDILNVTLLSGFTPAVSDEFTIMTYTGTLSSTFITVNLPSPQMDGWVVDYSTTGEIILKRDPALPLVWGAFTVENTEKYVQLNWTTETEINNDYFILQRSNDSKNWKDIAKIESHGNSKKREYYALNDDNPIFGIAYYRLSQVDFDGEQTVSKVLSVFRNLDKYSIKLSPNPTSGKVNIHYDLKAIKKVMVYNYLGQLSLVCENPNNIDLSGLPDGIYYISIETTSAILPIESMIIKKK